MYKIEELNLKGEKGNILNKGKTILLPKEKKNFINIELYEKSDESDYKLKNEIKHDDPYRILYLTTLSNEMIITSSIYTIRIYKKGENSSYQIYQIFKILDWNEIYKIKEFENSNFAVCGGYGFIIFNKNNNEYEVSLEINESTLGEHHRIFDFMKIKGEKDAFILYGRKKAFIINDKNIINQTSLDYEFINYLNNYNLICHFNDELYILSGKRHITVININENEFKQIDFLKEVKRAKKHQYEKEECPFIYKYNSNSIILIFSKGIFIIQIINNEKIQIKLSIKLDINEYYHYLNYIEEEKAIYYNDINDKIKKLKIKKKYA